jgi:hypothetical protein
MPVRVAPAQGGFEHMKKSYLIVGIVVALFAITSAASAVEYETVDGYKNCVGLQEATQNSSIALTRAREPRAGR